MTRRFRILIFVCLLVAGRSAAAQQFVLRNFQDEQGVHRYTVFVPAGYTPSRRWPAILYLHGAGERGTDGIKPTLVGIGPYAKARGSSFPFLIVFPQVEDTQGRVLTAWQAGQPAGERALRILDEVQRTFAVDPQHVSLVGWSMGGYGAWSLGAAYPQRWSAVVPMSGGGDPDKVAGLKSVPVWAFHGTGDQLVPIDETRKMVDALRAAGGQVAYTEFDEGHDISADVFGNDGFFAWLSDPRRRPPQLAPSPRILNVQAAPFVAALEIPQAAGIRLGNDVLEAISYAAPQLIPPTALTGTLHDMYDSTTAQGRSFSVTFSGISYTGQLERAVIRAIGPNRVRVQLGLRDITLTIGGTSVMGARHSAQAGPISIGIGHNRPVWLTIDVAPVVENHRLRLKPLAASFPIPPDTYYVTEPAGVSVHGWGMTRSVVANGLVSGLYGARSRIENEVQAIVPGIVQHLESQLNFNSGAAIVGSIWPLPVYQPRLQAVPEYAAADENGISILLGIAAAEPDLSAPRGQKQVAPPAGTTLQELGRGKSMSVAVAPQVLAPLTKMLIDADLAHINVLDVPQESLHQFADRKTLEEVLPDLKRFDDSLQINSELILVAPLFVQPGQTATGDSAIPLQFQLPDVRIAISTRQGDNAQWRPYAHFDMHIQEEVTAKLDKPSHERRELELNWTDVRSLTGEGAFAEGAQPQDNTVNADRFVELFREAWQKWTASGPAAYSKVPDIQFAATRLRMEQIGGAGAALTGVFRLPTIRITNRSDQPFIYETKGPYSGWGGPYTLEPGKSHDYELPYPLTYRHRGATGMEVYSLFVGSNSEVVTPTTGGPPRLFQAAK